MVGWLATIVIQNQSQFDSIAIMAVDLVVLSALALLAWHSGRDWAVWATACQAIVVATHFAYLMNFQIAVHAYLNAQVVSGYAMVLCLGVGTAIVWWQREALRGMS